MASGVFWCTSCNVPLLNELCERCGGRGVFVKLGKHVDPRPAFDWDVSHTKKVLDEEFGSGAGEAVIGEGVVLLNKLPYLDKAYEAVCDGEIVGHVFFDLFALRWRFKPYQEGWLRLLEHKLGSWAMVAKKRVEKGDVLNCTDFVEASLPECEERYLAILSRRREVIGVGELRKGSVRVLKAWKPRGEAIRLRTSSWSDVVEANKAFIVRSASRSSALLHKTSKRLGSNLVVSYSGGKDSLAALLLTTESGAEPRVLFNDTGVEMPETLENVERVSRALGVEVIYTEAGEAYWRGFELFGPPTRDNRWCSKLCKLAPATKALRSLKDVSATIVGQRRHESFARAHIKEVARSRWLPHTISIAPISGWSMLLVWLYLMWANKMSLVNQLYLSGFDRVGCFACPAGRVADFLLVKERHPSLWQSFEEELRKWGSSRGLPEEWVDYGLWRWRRRFPKGQLRVAEKLGISVADVRRKTATKYVSGFSLWAEGEGWCASCWVTARIELARAAKALPSVGEVFLSDDSVRVEAGDVGRALLEQSGRLLAFAKSGEDALSILEKAARAVLGSMLCVGCGLCEEWCPEEAIDVSGFSPEVDERKCVRCGLCFEKCPVSAHALRGFPRSLQLPRKSP